MSDITHYTWDVVLKMQVFEFLNLICYIRDKNKWEAEQQKKWQATH